MSEAEHEPKTSAGKARGRWALIALAAVLGVALGGGAYAWRASQATVPTPKVASLGQPGIGGAFQLIDQDGQAVTESVLRGRWSAVFFGYTSCPDICPATLMSLQGAVQRLGEDARGLQVVMITVDPERDDPAALKAFLDGYEFPGGAHGLTGTPEQVKAAVDAWRVYQRKVEPAASRAAVETSLPVRAVSRGEPAVSLLRVHGPDHGAYLVDHSTAVYLMNPQGEFAALVAPGLSPEETARQIRQGMGA